MMTLPLKDMSLNEKFMAIEMIYVITQPISLLRSGMKLF